MKKIKVTIGILLFIAAAAVFKEYRHHLWWDNFGVVEDQAVYRSGQLQPHQLEQAIRRLGIKTVINTREPDAPLGLMLAEYEVCWRAGVDLVRLPMPGDGRGAHERLTQAVAVLADSHRYPVLVHCARGTHRTGAVVASFRVFEQGWEPDRALAEMTAYRFKPKGHPLGPYLRDFWVRAGEPGAP